MRICGLDEAGRGPLAGPIVGAAVVAPADVTIDAIDSKKMTPKSRAAWVESFKAAAEDYHIQYAYYIINVPQINQAGISWANKEIFRQLILRLDADQYIVDGNHALHELGDKQNITQSVVGADSLHPVVSAASILAKTHRDEIMLDLHKQFPHYNWHQNKGYGTAQHISAIKTFGGTPHHRGQFVSTVESKTYTDPRYPIEPLFLLGPGAVLPILIPFLSQLI